MTCKLSLPYPPSVNRYWRSLRSGPMAGRVLVSSEGRAYRDAVARVARAQAIVSASGELAVDVLLVPGDRRRRDVDNPLKALLDALTHAGAWADDSQIRRLVVLRHDPVPGAAAAVVEIRPWEEENDSEKQNP